MRSVIIRVYATFYHLLGMIDASDLSGYKIIQINIHFIYLGMFSTALQIVTARYTCSGRLSKKLNRLDLK